MWKVYQKSCMHILVNWIFKKKLSSQVSLTAHIEWVHQLRYLQNPKNVLQCCSIQNLCNPTPEFSNILWHWTKNDGPKVFGLAKIKPEYFNILYYPTHFPDPLVCRIRQVPLYIEWVNCILVTLTKCNVKVYTFVESIQDGRRLPNVHKRW